MWYYCLFVKVRLARKAIQVNQEVLFQDLLVLQGFLVQQGLRVSLVSYTLLLSYFFITTFNFFSKLLAEVLAEVFI